MSGKQRKPTGVIGTATLYGDGRQTYDQVVFPARKGAIEHAIVGATLSSKHFDVRRFYNLREDPIPLPEHGWDFQLNTIFGVRYLELMEVAVLDGTGGYEGASNIQQLGELADAIYAGIQEKVATYGPNPRSSINLLLYSTDYRFDITGGAEEIIARRLNNRNQFGRTDHCFSTVLYCVPSPEDTTLVRILFPLSKSEVRRLKSEEYLRQITVVHFDLRQRVVRIPAPAKPSVDESTG